MWFLNNFRGILKDYCLHSSLAGYAYIADKKYHYTERIFWLICVILSWIGSFHLIKQSMNTFESDSISMVAENLRPLETTNFPSIAVCEMGYTKEFNENLFNILDNLRKESESLKYDYDIEDFMLRVVYHNLYNFGSITAYCSPVKNCSKCVRCPSTGYKEVALKVRAKCNELFGKCSWNGQPFECCHYFKPLQTTLGKCFLLNSIQTVEKYGKNWLDMTIGWYTEKGPLEISLQKATSLYIINEEDIPHMLLTNLQFPQLPQGYEGTLLLSLQNMVNDEGVRDIDDGLRKCTFPDEPHDSKYKFYSYSVCLTECLKLAQIKICGCSHYNMLYNDNDDSPVCDYYGLQCLDQADLMFPRTTIMQPWRTNGLVCHCLPSCTEHEIRIVGRMSKVAAGQPNRSVAISLQSFPSQRYRRQAVRENIDIVVSIGGILGLFMGASILSGVELIYFFTVRFCGTLYMKRRI